MFKLLKKLIKFVMSFNGIFMKSHKDYLPEELNDYLDSQNTIIRFRNVHEDKINLRNDYLNVSKDLNRAYTRAVQRRERVHG